MTEGQKRDRERKSEIEKKRERERGVHLTHYRYTLVISAPVYLIQCHATFAL